MRPQLRYLAILATILAVPASAAAQVYPERIQSASKAAAAASAYRQRHDDSREEQTERTTKTVHVGPNGTLDLRNIAGDITVSRGSGSDATIEIVKTARGHSVDDAKEMLGQVTVDVNDLPGRAEVRVRYPQEGMLNHSRHNLNVSVAYNVTAPSEARIIIESISGSVKISDIKGEINASTISGDLRISSAGRVGTLKTISGTVELTDAQIDGTLEASSVSGDLALRRVRARQIQGGTVSGGIQVEDAQCDRVSLHSTSGNLSYAGTLAKNGRYELKTFSGDVRIAAPGNNGFELQASSFSGDVHSDLPLTTHGTTDQRPGRHRTLTGTYGDGSAVLDVTTFSGRIIISKR